MGSLLDCELLTSDPVAMQPSVIQQCLCVRAQHIEVRARPVSVEGRGFLRKQQSIQTIRTNLV